MIKRMGKNKLSTYRYSRHQNRQRRIHLWFQIFPHILSLCNKFHPLKIWYYNIIIYNIWTNKSIWQVFTLLVSPTHPVFWNFTMLNEAKPRTQIQIMSLCSLALFGGCPLTDGAVITFCFLTSYDGWVGESTKDW